MSAIQPPPSDLFETRRLEALWNFDILDTPAEREFDEIARLAAAALGVASVAISLIDAERQWFKARHGIPFSETPREIAFCTHAVASKNLLVVPDASKDSRFSSNPLVTSEGGIRFYAGIPLVVRSGHCLGTLCVFDPKPRSGLTPAELAILRDLARLAVDLIESRHFRRLGEIAAKIVEATSDAVLAVEANGVVAYWNGACERLMGLPAGEAIGRDLTEILPSDLVSQLHLAFAAGSAGDSENVGVEQRLDMTISRAEGMICPVGLSLARWGDDKTELGIVAVIRDISVRVDLEKDRQRAQDSVDAVVTSLPAMLFVKDAETREYLMINRAGEEIMGKNAKDILGATDSALFPSQGAKYEERDNAAAKTSAPTVFESVFQ